MKILIICQWFPPEHAPIGIMLRELSRDLTSKGHEVTVITGYPNHPSGTLFPGYRKRFISVNTDEGGVRIIRCWLYTSPRKTVFHRALNFLTFAVTSFFAALGLERQDILFMVSPPLSNGLIAMFLKGIKGLRFVFNVQDIYPDAAIAAGILHNRFLIGASRWLESAVYRRADAVSVISDGFMKNLVAKGVPPEKIDVVYNWLDTAEIGPVCKDNPFARKYGLTDRFVVLYSGTIGLVSGAGILLECARKLRSHDDIIFLFVGEGVMKDILMRDAEEMGLNNVRFLPFQPREILSEVQSSADVSVVTLRKGNYSVPSKILGYMAAARPVVAAVDPESDTAGMMERSGCGIQVNPDDVDGLKGAILHLYYNRCLAKAMGMKGRRFLMENCDRKAVTARYEILFQRCVRGSV